MKSIARYLLLSLVLATSAIVTQMPATALAEDLSDSHEAYWRKHWRWYDETYRPYYYRQRRSTLYVPSLPDWDPRIKGSYGPEPYWGPYWGGTFPTYNYGWW